MVLTRNVSVNKAFPEDRRKFVKGFHVLENDVPSHFTDDPYNCPFLIDESCEGAKDPEFATRCSGEGFQYAQCKLYQIKMEVNYSQPVNKSLQDTVIMSAEDIIGDRRRAKSKVVGDYESIHDQVADDSEHRASFSFMKAMLGDF